MAAVPRGACVQGASDLRLGKRFSLRRSSLPPALLAQKTPSPLGPAHGHAFPVARAVPGLGAVGGRD